MPDLRLEQLLVQLRALRSDLERRGVTHALLFGSRARQDNSPNSDIDLAIDVGDNSGFSLIDLVGVGQRIEDSTGLPANIFMRRSLDNEFLAELNRDAVRVF